MKKTIILSLVLAVLLSICPVYAQAAGSYDDALNAVNEKLLENNPDPVVGSVGGEWAILALARSNSRVSNEYYNTYIQKADAYVSEGSARRYTDYSRILLTKASLGCNTDEVKGYLDDYDNVVSQGINGAIYALIALDSKDYNDDVKQRYLNYILEKQHSDGGFGLSDDSDGDITAMAIQAISKYKDDETVKSKIDNAVSYLNSIEITSLECAAQSVIAMCTLGLDPYKYTDELMRYYNDGQFEHRIGSGVDVMATEQGACALTALYRYKNGMNSLYDMSDVAQVGFLDVSTDDLENINFLKENGIMTGRSQTEFAPDDLITRAEFAAIVVRALKYKITVEEAQDNPFIDVSDTAWYKDTAVIANKYGLIKGISDTEFAPNDNVTREMAMVILTRLCKNIGIDTTVSDTEINISDYDTVSDWAKEETTFCIESGYFKEESIKPLENITRIETARMLAQMLWID